MKKQCDCVDNERNKLLYDCDHCANFGAKFFGKKFMKLADYK